MQLEKAKEILDGMVNKYFFIENREETVERAIVNEGTKRVVITTDYKERKCKLEELEEHLKLYKSEKTPDESLALRAVNKNVSFGKTLDQVEGFLIESMEKLKSGNADQIPVAMAQNKLATTLINMQKVKVETGKLLLDAVKTSQKGRSGKKAN